MQNLDRRQMIVYVAAALAVVLIGARYLRDAKTTTSNSGVSQAAVRVSDGGGHSERPVVHVAGEVMRPGVYTLAREARVLDAVRRAGGKNRRADLDALNLAAKVMDGQQIVVPNRSTGDGAVSAGSDHALNLNQATAEQLDQLDGIGSAMAEQIVEYRKQNGGFRSVADLDKIAGIGEKRLASLKEQLTG